MIKLFPLFLFLSTAVCVVQAQTAPPPTASTPQTLSPKDEEAKALFACAQMVVDQLHMLKISDDRSQRFQGKLSEATVLCRGGEQALQFRGTPWVDWSNYWGTGDLSSLPKGFISTKLPTNRGVTGALLDLELQRVELIKFNLFDNSGTYKDYVLGESGTSGPALKVWPEMRLAVSDAHYKDVGGDGAQQCKGDLYPLAYGERHLQ